MQRWQYIRFLGLVLALCWPIRASAHRMDEYLQATYITIGTRQMEIELVITPGISLAKLFYDELDTDHNGQLSPGEHQRYAQLLLADLTLERDGKPLPMTIQKTDFPPLVALTDGVGHIKIWLLATVPDAAPSGTHKLFFQNVHRPMQSVYLLNALMPTDKAITITNQIRDKNQYNITLTYNQLGAFPEVLHWNWLAGFGGLLLGWWLLLKRNKS